MGGASAVLHIFRKVCKYIMKKNQKPKSLKECFDILLNMPVQGKGAAILEELGIDAKNVDNRMLLAIALFEKAAYTPDVAAIKEIRSITDDGTEHGGELTRLINELRLA